MIVIVLVAVIPLTGLLFYTASEQKRQSAAAIERNILTIAKSSAREEAEMLDGSRQMLLGLALTLRGKWSAPPECSAYLSELIGRYRRYQNIGAIAADGSLLCSALPFLGEFDAREQPWFRQAMATREFSIGELHFGGRPLNPMVVLAYPVESNGRQLIGVALAVLDIQWLDRFALEIEKTLPEGSVVAQVDENGAILATHPNLQDWEGWQTTHHALLAAYRSGSKGMAALPGPDGRRWLYAFPELHSTLRSQKAHLVIGVPQATIYAEANRLLVHNLILLAGATFLILLTAWFGIDLLVLRQVRAILAATRKLTGGDLSARTGISRRPGELNELAEAFDNMAAALEVREAQRQKTDRDLRDSREELRSLASHLESVREEERTRLAREIHDELGQAMTALKMDTAWLSRRFNPNQDALHEKTRSMESLIDATILTVQRLSGELRPGLLDDLGIAAAIEWQCGEFQKRTGTTCAARVDLEGATLSREHATTLFRIFQETLTNVIRHSLATRVEVRLRTAGGRFEFMVSDNGRGITPKETEDPRAFGLIGMRERVFAIKGEFAISGQPGQGTTVTVTLPRENKG